MKHAKKLVFFLGNLVIPPSTVYSSTSKCESVSIYIMCQSYDQMTCRSESNGCNPLETQVKLFHNQISRTLWLNLLNFSLHPFTVHEWRRLLWKFVSMSIKHSSKNCQLDIYCLIFLCFKTASGFWLRCSNLETVSCQYEKCPNPTLHVFLFNMTNNKTILFQLQPDTFPSESQCSAKAFVNFFFLNPHSNWNLVLFQQGWACYNAVTGTGDDVASEFYQISVIFDHLLLQSDCQAASETIVSCFTSSPLSKFLIVTVASKLFRSFQSKWSRIDGQ